MAKSNTSKLQKECDRLMQEVGKLKFPTSFISNAPTDVMHHYVPKSVSSGLRYDWDNLIPLTNAEHCRLHQSPDPDIENRILFRKGGESWYQQLRLRGNQYHKVNVAMYETIKKGLLTEKSAIADGLL